MYVISSANSDSLIFFSFPICISLISVFCLIASSSLLLLCCCTFIYIYIYNLGALVLGVHILMIVMMIHSYVFLVD